MADKQEEIKTALTEQGVSFIYDMGTGLWICKVPIDKIREQDINARIMKSDLQDRLTSNIKDRGQLESLPLLAFVNDRLEIISGHHRYRSARAAGMKEMVCIVDVTGLTRSKIVSKQLAHNAIEGIDDQDTLKELCRMIDNVDDMIASAINEDFFKHVNAQIDKIATRSTKFDFKQILFTFLPHQEKALNDLIEKAPKADMAGVADINQFSDFVNALERTQKFQDVKSVGTAIYLMVHSALKELDANGYTDVDMEWMPLSKIFGGAVIPKECGEVIKKAISKAEKDGECDKNTRWIFVESLCRNYLEGKGWCDEGRQTKRI